jgi:hypothetical protein
LYLAKQRRAVQAPGNKSLPLIWQLLERFSGPLFPEKGRKYARPGAGDPGWPEIQ